MYDDENYDDGFDDEKLAVVERLIAWCEDRDRTLLELAISWHTSHPLVASVIAGATKPAQIEANVAAAGWDLTPEDRAEVDAVLEVPIRELLDPAIHRTEIWIRDGAEFEVTFFELEQDTLWGATARMLCSLFDRLARRIARRASK